MKRIKRSCKVHNWKFSLFYWDPRGFFSQEAVCIDCGAVDPEKLVVPPLDVLMHARLNSAQSIKVSPH